jgi:xanthine dehydrogenase accessory factor
LTFSEYGYSILWKPIRGIELYEITGVMRRWSNQPGKKPLYAATVISVEGSAVRGPGASMGIAADGSLAGSVSGGCIESTVITAAEGLRHRGMARTITFCPDDDSLMGAPAPCGGTVSVCVFPYAPAVGDALERRIDSEEDGAWGLVVEGPNGLVGTSFALDEQGELVTALNAVEHGHGPAGRDGTPDRDDTPDRDGMAGRDGKTGKAMNEAALISALKTAPRDGFVTDLGGLRVFVQQIPLPPHAIVVGGGHIGETLAAILKNLHWKVTIVEPREMFAAPMRFQVADAVLHLWPGDAFEQLGLKSSLDPGNEMGTDQGPRSKRQNAGTDDPVQPRYTAVAAITHTEQIDDEAVALGIRNRCFSVGVLGSTRTFSARISRLKELGFTDEELGRVHGPIGLDIGAGTPEEIALAIAAEMVQDYRSARRRENRG